MIVGIIYGWSEGAWQGKKLRSELHKQGYTITSQLENADIIIAHSGGIYLLPENSRANTIMLIGMPYYPNKHILRSLREKVKHEVKDLWWYKKTFYNAFYFITRPYKWYSMWRAWKENKYPTSQYGTVVAVRNEQDHFMHPTDSEAFANKNGWMFEKLPGTHDDLWANPKPYVDLIKKYNKL